MKIIKYLFFLLLIAIIAGAIYIATQDGEYYVEETAVINAPVPVVFNEVNNYVSWEEWGPWRHETDDMVIQYEAQTRGEGAGFNWKSENLGNGYIVITRAIPDNSIDQRLVHNPAFTESESRMYWKFEEVDEGTKVTVGMEGIQGFKEKLAFALSDRGMKEAVSPRLSKGLERLNASIEKKMSEYSIAVEGVTTHGGGFYMYTTTASNINQIPVKMQAMLSQVRQYMETNNIPAQGDPFILYNDLDENNNTAIYSAGIFTPGLVITPTDSEVLNGMLPVQRVVKTTLKGDTENLKEAWERAYSYIDQNNLQPDEQGQPFEVYRVTGETTLNPANWVTELYIPVTDVVETEIETEQ